MKAFYLVNSLTVSAFWGSELQISLVFILDAINIIVQSNISLGGNIILLVTFLRNKVLEPTITLKALENGIHLLSIPLCVLLISYIL